MPPHAHTALALFNAALDAFAAAGIYHRRRPHGHISRKLATLPLGIVSALLVPVEHDDWQAVLYYSDRTHTRLVREPERAPLHILMLNTLVSLNGPVALVYRDHMPAIVRAELRPIEVVTYPPSLPRQSHASNS